MPVHENELLPLLVEELRLHPECGAELYAVSAGSRYPNPVAPENYSKIDRNRLAAISTSNWFGAETNSVSRIVYSQRKNGTQSFIGDCPANKGKNNYFIRYALLCSQIVFLFSIFNFF